MPRRRPRRVVRSWTGHLEADLLFLAVLYLTAAGVNLPLAVRMRAWWPALSAVLMAMVSALCVTAAVRRRRRG